LQDAQVFFACAAFAFRRDVKRKEFLGYGAEGSFLTGLAALGYWTRLATIATRGALPPKARHIERRPSESSLSGCSENEAM
jgi:hypothetical protein